MGSAFDRLLLTSHARGATTKMRVSFGTISMQLISLRRFPGASPE
jgi:hypothetical protein